MAVFAVTVYSIFTTFLFRNTGTPFRYRQIYIQLFIQFLILTVLALEFRHNPLRDFHDGHVQALAVEFRNIASIYSI